MTKVLEILHLADTDEIRLAIKSAEGVSDESYRSAPPVEFKEALSPSFHREIGWYFQGYLDNPFGPAKERAQAVESTMQDLGRLLFQAAMQSSQEARDFYAEACADGLSSYQLAGQSGLLIRWPRRRTRSTSTSSTSTSTSPGPRA